jgi:hypothetical protein
MTEWRAPLNGRPFWFFALALILLRRRDNSNELD